MNYAQKDYGNKLGTSDDTIAESGALLTAFSNLLTHFDIELNPLKLTTELKTLGEDASKLTWGHLSMIDPHLAIHSVGTGAPQYSDSIVKLQYTSKLTGDIATTYACVLDASAGTIIDSFDGTEKIWDIYGGPKTFVTFAKYPDYVVTPLKAPAVVESEPQEPVEASAPEFTVIDGTAPVEQEAATEAIETTEEATIPVRVVAPDPDKWKHSFKKFLHPIEAIVKTDMVVADLDGKEPSRSVPAEYGAKIGGYVRKDDKTYYLSTVSIEKQTWYGYPAGSLRKTEEQKEQEFDEMINKLDLSVDFEQTEDLNRRERLIKKAATTEGKIKNIRNIFKKKSNEREKVDYERS